jgi:hypothetical protein
VEDAADLPPAPASDTPASATSEETAAPLSQTQDAPEPPRRTGWWSRRFAINKG